MQLITGFITKGGEFDTDQFRFDGKGKPTYQPTYVKKDSPMRWVKRKLFVAWRNFKQRRQQSAQG